MSGLAREPADFFAPPWMLRRIRVRSLVIGIVASVVAVVIGLIVRPDSKQFFRSYLLAWEYWNNFSLGCLGIVMMTNVTGGRWGFVIRRPLEAGTRLLSLTGILGIPLLIWGIPRLYIWGNAVARAHDEKVSHNLWLTPQGFIFRYVLYFLIWILLAALLDRYSARQDRIADLTAKRRLTNVSGPGLVLYVLTVTFSSIDWLMSLDPHWSSSIYGFLLIAGQALAAMAFMLTVLLILIKAPPMSAIVKAQQFHDLGKLMLTFVMLWAYFSFSQLLLIWSGNLPEEITWYLHRLRGGWWWVGMVLIFLHFALPFALLLSRDLKRDARGIAYLAAFIIAMRFVDLVYLVVPNPLPLRPQGMTFSWLDIVLTVGIGGIWMGAFFWQLAKRPLVPLYDPLYEEVVGRVGKP